MSGSGYGDGMGGYGSLMLVNPQLAIALRNQQLGLPFLQQGTQSDPIRSPWQGVNRVANALLGAVLMRRGMDQQQQSIDAQRALASQAAQDWNQGGGMGLGQPSPQALGGALKGGGGGGGDTSGATGAAPPPAASGGAASDNPLLGPLVTTDLRGQPIAGTGGGTQVAQAGNVATDAGGGGGAPTGGGGQPATGINSPQVQEALRLQNMAMEIRRRAAAAGFPNDPTSNMYANAYEARAKLLMGLESHQTTVGQYGPVDTNVLTGEQKPWFTRTNTIADQQGNQYVVHPDGSKTLVTSNPTGLTGPANSPLRVMTELAPIMQSGNYTPQQAATYAAAADAYQGFEIRADNTGALRRLPTRPLPAGFPQPPSFVTGQPPNAPAPNAPPAGGQQPPLAPGQQTSAQPAGGDNTVLAPGLDPRIKELLGPDAKAVASADEEVAKGKGTLATTQTIRSMLPQTATGPLAMQKQATARVLATLGVSQDEIQKLTDTNLPMSEVLQKKLFELTTHAVRAMGAREPGSVMLSFANNYPGMTSQKLTIDAMTRLYDMDQIRAQDYAQGKRQAYLSGNMGNFDKNFQNSNDERVYQGAALASGGMPYDVWSKGLSNDQQVQALNLAKRVYPDAKAYYSDGKQYQLNPPQNSAAGGAGG